MARKIRVSYLPEPAVDPKTGRFLGTVFRPKIPIWISFKGKHGNLFNALVDSGSDRNLFPAGIGEFVGIDIQKGKKSLVYGIGKSKIVTYEHEVTFTLVN